MYCTLYILRPFCTIIKNHTNLFVKSCT